MIYTFRFEYSAQMMGRDTRQFYWNEMMDGRIHQGWGSSGMSLLSPAGSALTREEWVPKYLAAAEKAGWGSLTEAEASRRYTNLFRMCLIQPGDLIVVLNISESSRDGLAIVTASRSGIAGSSGCYSWERGRKKGNPFEDDFRHCVSIDPSDLNLLYVPYDPKMPDGRRAALLRTKLQPFRNCVSPIEQAHSEIVRDIEALLKRRVKPSAKKPQIVVKGRPGRPPSPAQVERGKQAEEEVLQRINQGKCYGLVFSRDRRQDGCGYDFLCKDADGHEIDVEVKGFTRNGQLFMTENELERAKKRKHRYWLIGLVDIDPNHPEQWPASALKDPARELLKKGVGILEYVCQLRANPSKVNWDHPKQV
jgi:Domain of unknown function (DUF3883)